MRSHVFEVEVAIILGRCFRDERQSHRIRPVVLRGSLAVFANLSPIDFRLQLVSTHESGRLTGLLSHRHYEPAAVHNNWVRSAVAAG